MSTELKKLLEKGQGLIFLFYIFRLIKERKRQVKERRPGRERGESSKQLNHDEPSTTDLLSRERSAEVLGLIIKSNKIWMDLQVHHIVMGLLENKKNHDYQQSGRKAIAQKQRMKLGFESVLSAFRDSIPFTRPVAVGVWFGV